jgi:hypothetical protein
LTEEVAEEVATNMFSSHARALICGALQPEERSSSEPEI